MIAQNPTKCDHSKNVQKLKMSGISITFSNGEKQFIECRSNTNNSEKFENGKIKKCWMIPRLSKLKGQIRNRRGSAVAIKIVVIQPNMIGV